MIDLSQKYQSFVLHCERNVGQASLISLAAGLLLAILLGRIDYPEFSKYPPVLLALVILGWLISVLMVFVIPVENMIKPLTQKRNA